MSIKIITNNVPRFTLDWHELTAKEQAEFDYLDTEDKQAEAEFFRYKGNVYHTGDIPCLERHFIAVHPEFKGWDGRIDDTFFSGILVRYVFEHGSYTQQVIVGRYYA